MRGSKTSGGTVIEIYPGQSWWQQNKNIKRAEENWAMANKREKALMIAELEGQILEAKHWAEQIVFRDNVAGVNVVPPEAVVKRINFLTNTLKDLKVPPTDEEELIKILNQHWWADSDSPKECGTQTGFDWLLATLLEWKRKSLRISAEEFWGILFGPEAFKLKDWIPKHQGVDCVITPKRFEEALTTLNQFLTK